MREILHFQVGQCGNNISSKFWEVLCKEHDVDASGVFFGTDDTKREELNVYFKETIGGRYTLRTIPVDLDPDGVRIQATSPYRCLLPFDSFVVGQCGTGNNWGRGYYTDGAELMYSVLDVARRHIEDCDSLQGLQISHSLGGGTGSGMGTLLTSKLRELIPGQIIETFTVLPSPYVSDTVVEPYNCVSGLNQLIENVDTVVTLDNEALYNMCSNGLKIQTPTYGDLNHIVTYIMAGTTSSFRFQSSINSTMRRFAANLVPFPGLNFTSVGVAPLTQRGTQTCPILTARQLSQQIFDRRHMSVAMDPRRGRYLTAMATFRGHVSSKDVAECMFNIANRGSSYFVQWIPDNLKAWVCERGFPSTKASATLIANSTAISQRLEKISEAFNAMFRRRAFMYGYMTQGMDEMELVEADENLKQLITAYRQYQQYTIEDEESE